MGIVYEVSGSRFEGKTDTEILRGTQNDEPEKV